MNEDNRPNPDALLEALKKEEAKQQRGKLKIFLGMSAGVGKTYAMLEAAQQRLADGVDVVIGYVETHKRVETQALLQGLPIIPRQKVEYRGSTLEEMDVDAVLARKPQLALVDELAHTNVPGTRHPKRYQDVLDLLTAGIDVYTTVNVQHFESRADAVQQITGITVHETVPDTLIDIANDIELIDLEPEELLKRLAEGKVYTHDRAELAVRNFFRKGNLTALREMALRLTAERVDQEMQDYMQIKRISGPWKSAERLMVAVSPSPLSERLVRWTRRVAYNLKAPWLAVFVEPPQPLSDEQKTQLARNLSLVHKLGGEVVTVTGSDVVGTLMRVAHERNVTQIVIGKPVRNPLQEMLRGGSVVNQLVHASGEIDVYVVSGDRDAEPERRLAVPRPRLESRPNQYLIALLIVLGAVGICYAVSNSTASVFIGYQEIALILLLMIVLMANFLGRGPILVAAALSALLWDYLFIPPRYTLLITNLRDILIFGLYFLVALVTGNLTSRQRLQAKALAEREEGMSAFSTMAQELAHAVTMDDVLKTAIEQVSQVFDAEITILIPDGTGHLSNTPRVKDTMTLDQKEFSVATWAFQHSEIAGRFTDTLPTAAAQYIPLVTPGGVVGVMGIRQDERPTVDQDGLLSTFANHISLVVERTLQGEAARHRAVLDESEHLASTLLDSVSQELRTPIAAIREAATALLDAHKQGDEDAELAYGDEIQLEAIQLSRVVGNLLDMTRLESGHIQLNLDWHSVGDLVNKSVKRVEKELAAHDLVIDVPADLPKVRIDLILMEQVLVNLLHNAAMYTPPNVRVRITARVEGSQLVLSVADRGPGLPPADLNRVFEKFYRAPGSVPGGTGLGLSICRGLVEAHGGTISAENRPHGGARFTIRLPIDGGTKAQPVEG